MRTRPGSFGADEMIGPPACAFANNGESMRQGDGFARSTGERKGLINRLLPQFLSVGYASKDALLHGGVTYN